MNSSKPRLAALLTATSLLSACGMTRSDLVSACPPVVAYSQPFLDRAAQELGFLPAGSAIQAMLADYAVMRDQARACQR